jgi:hypothetical protein
MEYNVSDETRITNVLTTDYTIAAQISRINSSLCVFLSLRSVAAKLDEARRDEKNPCNPYPELVGVTMSLSNGNP